LSAHLLDLYDGSDEERLRGGDLADNLFREIARRCRRRNRL
jgi:hypothetical protein